MGAGSFDMCLKAGIVECIGEWTEIVHQRLTAGDDGDAAGELRSAFHRSFQDLTADVCWHPSFPHITPYTTHITTAKADEGSRLFPW